MKNRGMNKNWLEWMGEIKGDLPRAYWEDFSSVKHLADLFSQLSNKQGGFERAFAIHYRLHCDFEWPEFARQIDQKVFQKPYVEKFNEPVWTQVPELAPNQNASAWKVDEKSIRFFFDPILSEEKVEQLVKITKQVVQSSLGVNPLDFRDSISERAIDEGVVDSQSDTLWLTSALQCGLKPDTMFGFQGDDPVRFETLFVSKKSTTMVGGSQMSGG